jgi:hypothetical protein
MGIGALLCASISTLWYVRGNAIWRAIRKQGDVPEGSFVVLMGIVVAILTLGLSFEIDRIVESAATLSIAMAFPVAQEKMLAWTALWTVAVMVLMAIVTVARPAGVQRSRWSKRIWLLTVLLAAKFVLIDTAFFRIVDPSSAAAVLLNPQVLAATLIAGCLLLGNWLGGQNVDGDLTFGRMRSGAILLAIMVPMWAVTLEIDRVVEQMNAAGSLHWPLWQAKQLAWTIAWSLATAGAFAIVRWRAVRRGRDVQSAATAPPTEGWPRLLPQLLALLSVKYLTIDTALWRLLHLPANVTVLANLEASAGAVVFASLAMLMAIGLPDSLPQQQAKLRRVAGLLASLIVLWIGSIEIDRYFAAVAVFNGTVRPEQVALSSFWAIFAVACVLLGFRVRAAELRYFGLGLFALTLLKVVLIDMSQVQAGYRILSFMVLGALLMGTSVLYGKFGPRLLREDDEEESPISMA